MAKIIMTKKRAREWIVAIDKLIRYYERDAHRSPPCPFCSLSVELGCNDCLWVIYEGESCHGRMEYPRDKRIPRLNRWKARLNKIINRVA